MLKPVDRRIERSVDRGMMAFEELGRLTHRRALADELLTERDLLWAELRGASEPDPTRLRKRR